MSNFKNFIFPYHVCHCSSLPITYCNLPQKTSIPDIAAAGAVDQELHNVSYKVSSLGFLFVGLFGWLVVCFFVCLFVWFGLVGCVFVCLFV